MWEADYTPNHKENGFKRAFASLLHNKLLEKNEIKKIMTKRKHLTNPIIPTQNDEVIQSPIDGYMFGIFFDANDDGKLDTILKNFWIIDSFNEMTVYDLFFVSEGLTEKVSDDVSITINNLRSNGVLKLIDSSGYTSKSDLVAGKTKNFEILFTGSYTEGYELLFNNVDPQMRGELTYIPNPKGVLFYNNGKSLSLAGSNVKFYDTFLCDVSGKVTIVDTTYILRNARGFIQHFGGAFNINTIKKWNWINIQLPNGAIQVLLIGILLDKEMIIPLNEGVALINDNFAHFLDEDIKITPVTYHYNKHLHTDIPIEWKLSLKSKEGNEINLTLKSTMEYTLSGVVSKKPMIEYILDVSGDINRENIEGRGTIEILVA